MFLLVFALLVLVSGVRAKPVYPNCWDFPGPDFTVDDNVLDKTNCENSNNLHNSECKLLGKAGYTCRTVLCAQGKWAGGECFPIAKSAKTCETKKAIATTNSGWHVFVDGDLICASSNKEASGGINSEDCYSVDAKKKN